MIIAVADKESTFRLKATLGSHYLGRGMSEVHISYPCETLFPPCFIEEKVEEIAAINSGYVDRGNTDGAWRHLWVGFPDYDTASTFISALRTGFR